jgi:hypothetical protein
VERYLWFLSNQAVCRTGNLCLWTGSAPRNGTPGWLLRGKSQPLNFQHVHRLVGSSKELPCIRSSITRLPLEVASSYSRCPKNQVPRLSFKLPCL